LIVSGEGNADSVVTVMGLLVGAGIVHNFGLASSAAGPTLNGKIAVAVCFVFVGVISYFNSESLFKVNAKASAE